MSWPKLRLPLSWSAAPEGRSFYNVFMRRVIRIEPVARERELITDPDEIATLEWGRLPGEISTFAWSVDRLPEPLAVLGSYTMSEPMDRAWAAMLRAYENLLDDIVEYRRLIAVGATARGRRREIDPAEWLGSNVSIDVRSGDLFEWHTNSHDPCNRTIRFRSVTILPPELPDPPKTRGTIDRDDLWLYLNVLFERGELPATIKQAQEPVAKRYGVKFEEAGLSGDLSRYLSAVRRGAFERPKSSDRRQNHKEPR